MSQTTIIYTSATCPVCSMAKDLLNSLNEPYKEINIDINPVSVVQLIAKTKKFTVPQTIINGKVISGFKPEEVIQAMY
ncbi:glutaredoxin family protein [Salinicoccus sp. YB14-2]|uniref:glutaredoxin family protein n=1 Tax=Salinicoccus sp. YB14-2 TaxID=1572701 RepID=UPI00068C73F5|nr:glutaredoxin family protein [Salinicoccus sp. YB14-2]